MVNQSPAALGVQDDANRSILPWIGAIGIAGMALAGCQSPPRMASVGRPESVPAHVLFQDVSVFDGVDLRRHRDVLVTGSEITDVGPAGTVDAPAQALVLGGIGRTLVPGLIDAHVHLFSAGEKRGPPPEPRAIGEAFLFAGVTSVLVAAGFGEASRLDQQRRDGEALAPQLFTAGPGLSTPDGHPIPLLRAMLPWPARWFATRSILTAADSAEARARVTDIITTDDPDFVKIVYDDLPPGSPHLSQSALRGAIAEATARGVRSLVHATTPDDVMEALAAGAALMAHIPQRGVLTDDQVAHLATAGVPFVTTARLVSASHDLARQGATSLEQQMYGPRLLQPWLDEPRWELPGFSEEIDRRATEVAADTAANVRKLLAAGVPLFVGTDSGVHGVFPGASLHLEMRLLVDLGMLPLDVLRAATSAPAAFLDPSGRIGTIANGQRADLLLVRGDPTEEIADLAAIEEVFVGGVRLRRYGLSSEGGNGGRPSGPAQE